MGEDTLVNDVQNADASSGAEQINDSGVAPENTEPSSAEKFEQAVAASLERAERAIQSAKDKAIREVTSRQARQAATSSDNLAALTEELSDLDPEVAKEVELRARRAAAKNQAAEASRTAVADRAESFHQEFTDSLTALAVEAGVDPKDSRLDWAKDAGTDYLTVMKRFQSSLVKAIKAPAPDNAGKDALTKLAEERKAKGLESHTNPNLQGDTSQQSDQDFLNAFGNGQVEMTKANVERAEAIMGKAADSNFS